MSKIATIQINALHVGKSVSFECAQLAIKQNFAPTWSTEEAYGKMDPIATYANTKRNVSFDLTVLGKQPETAVSLQSKIDTLVKIQYPRYSSSNGGQVISAPPIFSVNVLNNRIYSVFKGYFTSFNINPGSNGGVPPLTIDGRFFERKYEISLGMQVLHSYIPGWIGDGDPGGSEGFLFEGTGTDGAGAVEPVPNSDYEGEGGQSTEPSPALPRLPIPSPEDNFNPAVAGGGAASAQTTEDREDLSPDQQEQARTGVA